MSKDTVFDDDASEAFLREIYSTTKGTVRLHVLWQDLLAEVRGLKAERLRVIDIGGGAGQLASKVAELGHEVTICDPSEEMLDKARACLEETGLGDTVRFVHASIQDLRSEIAGEFDLVICHAVLEWLAEPRDALDSMLPLLNADGYLSLMFYNLHAAILKRALIGDFAGALAQWNSVEDARDSGHPNPLDPEDVKAWIVESGLQVQSRSGIRIFHDHLPEALRRASGIAALLELETAFRKREPFASLAQHIHFVCRRQEAPTS